MPYTLQQMRDHVRLSLDVDTSDIPDSILDQWIREGWLRVSRRLRRWPFLEKVTTLNTTASDAGYLYTEINSTCDFVVRLNGPNWSLKYVPLEDAERMYPRNTTSTGEPLYWTRWSKGITLWPTPNAVYSIQVRYYETPIEWVTGGGSSAPSQLPDEFHGLIMQWALMRAHAQQEDLDLSTHQKRIFDEMLETVKRALEQEPTPQPLIIGGSQIQPYPANRLRFPFE